jgi:hypothetical protein
MRWPASNGLAATARMCCKPRAACHACLRAPDRGYNWPRIAALYDRLRVVAPSPVVHLNSAIAYSMALRARSGPLSGGRDRRRRRPARLRAICRRRGPTFCSGPIDWPRRVSEFKAAATLTRNARETAFSLRPGLRLDCSQPVNLFLRCRSASQHPPVRFRPIPVRR